MRGGMGSLSGRAGTSLWSDLPVSGRAGVPPGSFLPLNRIIINPRGVHDGHKCVSSKWRDTR
jgi:hypothetical protein